MENPEENTQYKPSDEEIANAEQSMSPEQGRLTEIRETMFYGNHTDILHHPDLDLIARKEVLIAELKGVAEDEGVASRLLSEYHLENIHLTNGEESPATESVDYYIWSQEQKLEQCKKVLDFYNELKKYVSEVGDVQKYVSKISDLAYKMQDAHNVARNVADQYNGNKISYARKVDIYNKAYEDSLTGKDEKNAEFYKSAIGMQHDVVDIASFYGAELYPEYDWDRISFDLDNEVHGNETAWPASISTPEDLSKYRKDISPAIV
jgi:hypothetical protein